MMFLAVTFTVCAALFTLGAAVDKRWADRLSRRGRRLAGIRAPKSPTLPSAEPSAPGPSSAPASGRTTLRSKVDPDAIAILRNYLP